LLSGAAGIYDIFLPYNRVQLSWHHISSAKRIPYIVYHNIYLDVLAKHFKTGNIILNKILLADDQAIFNESGRTLESS
jgi:cytochrome bd-type quinol oxidase subunit 1